MNSILIVVTKPAKTEKFQDERWTAFLHGSTKNQSTTERTLEGPERIAETAWLIRAQNGLPILSLVLGRADQCKLAYRVLFLEAATEWVCPTKAT
jgi:hypothetical protein